MNAIQEIERAAACFDKITQSNDPGEMRTLASYGMKACIDAGTCINRPTQYSGFSEVQAALENLSSAARECRAEPGLASPRDWFERARIEVIDAVMRARP